MYQVPAMAFGSMESANAPCCTCGKSVATDSTTMGSSGSPIFDANNGKLVGIVQYGTSDPGTIKDGLAIPGRTTIRAIKEAILNDAVFAADKSERISNEVYAECRDILSTRAGT